MDIDTSFMVTAIVVSATSKMNASGSPTAKAVGTLTTTAKA